MPHATFTRMYDLTLNPQEITELRAHLARLGETKCARALTVSRLALVRALAGLPCRRGTMLLLRSQLEVCE